MFRTKENKMSGYWQPEGFPTGISEASFIDDDNVLDTIIKREIVLENNDGDILVMQMYGFSTLVESYLESVVGKISFVVDYDLELPEQSGEVMEDSYRVDAGSLVIEFRLPESDYPRRVAILIDPKLNVKMTGAPHTYPVIGPGAVTLHVDGVENGGTFTMSAGGKKTSPLGAGAIEQTLSLDDPYSYRVKVTATQNGRYDLYIDAWV